MGFPFSRRLCQVSFVVFLFSKSLLTPVVFSVIVLCHILNLLLVMAV